jgi:hypothetical protein
VPDAVNGLVMTGAEVVELPEPENAIAPRVPVLFEKNVHVGAVVPAPVVVASAS